jgi:hypothetical protein
MEKREVCNLPKRRYNEVCKMIFKIEYEIPFMRAIWTTEIEAVDEKQARNLFQANNQRARIRKIEVNNP